MIVIDARGLICPLPVLKLRKVLLSLPENAEVMIDVTDKNALKDIPLFCAENGYSVLRQVEITGGWRVTVRASSVRGTK